MRSFLNRYSGEAIGSFLAMTCFLTVFGIYSQRNWRLSNLQASTQLPATTIRQLVSSPSNWPVLNDNSTQTEPCGAGNSTVCRSATLAKQLLGATPVADRMMVILLSSREKMLCCTVKLLQVHFFNETPADMFIFSPNNTAKVNAKKICPTLVSSSNIYFMAIDEHWEVPQNAATQSWMEYGEQKQTHIINYRLMGYWRLRFQFDFAREIGYKYLWQIDDDSQLLAPLGYNAIHRMENESLDIAGASLAGDYQGVLWGLAELTRYFIMTDLDGSAPQTLLDNCDPPTMHGLFTRVGEDRNETRLNMGAAHIQQMNEQKGFTGWNMEELYGNSIMFRVDFWFRPDVQRYLDLIHSTAGVFRFRWQEQGVMAMIWRLFVAPEHFQKMDFKFCHKCDIEGLDMCKGINH